MKVRTIRGIPVKKAPLKKIAPNRGGGLSYKGFLPPDFSQNRRFLEGFFDDFSAAGENFGRLRLAKRPKTPFLHDFCTEN